MAAFDIRLTLSEASAADFTKSIASVPHLWQQLASPANEGGSATTYYKMRALASPGPGYVTWVVNTTPDFTGTSAPSPIQGGTVVVSDTWVIA